MSLHDFQTRFLDAVKSADEPTNHGGFGFGIGIYRNNYRGQLRGALRDTFRHVLLWLGDDAFEAAAEAQIRNSPPTSWTLDAYGRDFPALLRQLYPQDPEVHELAWLDLAMSNAFVTADAVPVAPSHLARISWDRVRLRFVPLQLSEAATNASEIWIALEEGKMPPPARRLDRRGGYLVWRSGYVPRFRFAQPREYRSLCELYLGIQFDRVCSLLEAEIGRSEAIEAIGQILGRWLAEGIIAGVEPGPQ